jgi:hypothetical protein
MLQFWTFYQAIKKKNIFDEDISYIHILTSIRQKFTPKKDFEDLMCDFVNEI